MHELGIVFHIIKTVDRIGEKNKLSAVSSVTLELGEVSGVVDRELTDCWNWAVKKSALMKDAKLAIEKIKAYTRCEDCGGVYETVTYGRTCPFCGGGNTFLKSGNEINIKEIEAF